MQTQEIPLTNEFRIDALQAKIEQSQKEIRKAQAEIFRLTPSYTEAQQKAIKATLKKIRDQKYLTSNGLNIYKLRQSGCKVTVNHIRYTTMYTSKHTPIQVPVNTYMRGVYDFNAKGGVTHITILKVSTNKQITLTSLCHPVDSFDYKMAVKEALDQLTPDEVVELLA